MKLFNKNGEGKKKFKKDNLFILLSAAVLGNLAYTMWGVITAVILHPENLYFWALVVCNGIAIFGMLWLMRDYTARRKEEKALEKDNNDIK
jgi:hypothetical protein